jgi:hypothetical protein
MHPCHSDRLLSPWFLSGLAMLLLNDLILKPTFGNALTGKLSDFAGLFVFPVFWRALLPGWGRSIHLATAAGFIAWKSPLSQPLLDTWNRLSPWDLGRTIDWTDLTALVVIPVAYFYSAPLGTTIPANRCRWRPAVVVASMFAFAATSYRTNFRYEQSYSIQRPEIQIMAQIDSLHMNRFGPDESRGDSMEVWIPSDRCFRHVYAQTAVLRNKNGIELTLASLEHHCPKKKGDSLDLLRIFEHCFLARLDSALAVFASSGAAGSAPRITVRASKPRDSCVPQG